MNNKGITTIEILISFILTIIIVISMYATVSSLKNKQTTESNKEKLITYHDLLTKSIQDDIIFLHLIKAEKDVNNSNKVSLIFTGGSKKDLIIDSSNNSVMYGGENYDIPNLGSDIKKDGSKVYLVKILNEKVNIDIDDSSNTLTIYIPIYHPDLGTRYSINIVAPINY